ncbi:abortive infection family protein [Corynebacterium sp. FDAARGOS 1242]|nr:abortive infection family protein [Corynebacterium sp. FDAARGOS 1242]QRP97799.1 abortive infection family protein [Corynebacterium sp. FDAARGOS 1242]
MTMPKDYLSEEISICLGKFFFAGIGPSHGEITTCFLDLGLQHADPYDPSSGTPNKEQRILQLCREVRTGNLVDAKTVLARVLTMLRAHGVFRLHQEKYQLQISNLAAALERENLVLTDQGYVRSDFEIDLETGGREALEEHLHRLSTNSEDPGVLLGVAKELLESSCKFVLEESGMLPGRKADFDELVALTFERLNLLPVDVDISQPGGKQIRAIYQSARTAALQINELRNLQGTGHGRTLPTGVTVQAGRFVVREAAHVTELILTSHDRMRGRIQ